ncbi:hypothetical protein BpHYR1_045463 [Brachionus plicatilis]|uniref:Uncharacterized protein n=1 Tax=Brachionus plicatilis TaxID=10195 RepID=A0A3M7T4K5_BRAPC|nr:hypothetical protein BpHYR1_045463 [Brachionus plicatilis]
MCLLLMRLNLELRKISLPDTGQLFQEAICRDSKGSQPERLANTMRPRKQHREMSTKPMGALDKRAILAIFAVLAEANL